MSNAKNNISTPSVTPTIAQEATALPEAERQEFQSRIDALEKQLEQLQNSKMEKVASKQGETRVETQTASVSVTDMTRMYSGHLDTVELILTLSFTFMAAFIAIIAGTLKWIGYPAIKNMIEKAVHSQVADEVKEATDKLTEEAIDPLREEYKGLIVKQEEQAAELVAQSKRIEIEHYMTLAQHYYNEAKWVEAIKYYDEVISRDSDNALVYFNRGFSKFELEQYDAAIADYDEAIRLDLNDSAAYNNRGLSKARLKQYDTAIADYDEAIRIDPKNAHAYISRGVSKASLEQYEAAIADYDEAIRLNPNDSAAYNNRGLSKAGLEQYEAAIVDYDEAIRIDPKQADTYVNRGISKASLEQYDATIADCDEAIRIDPRNDAAYYNKSCTYVLMEKPLEETLELLKKAIELDNTNKKLAQDDDDFVSLRENEAFRKLVGLPAKK